MGIPFANLVDMLNSVAGRKPNRTAIIFGAKKITYKQLVSYSKKLASSLISLGIKPKDKVALWLPNCPEFVYGFFATLFARATVVPVNTMLTREEARFIIEDSKAKVLLCSIGKISDAENILSRSDSLRKVISHPKPQGNSAMYGLWEYIDQAEELKKPEAIDPSDLATSYQLSQLQCDCRGDRGSACAEDGWRSSHSPPVASGIWPHPR